MVPRYSCRMLTDFSRPHRKHAVHRCSAACCYTDVARSVVCVSVCWARVSCTKTTRPIEMPFGWLTLVSPRNRVRSNTQYYLLVYIRRGQDRTNAFVAARGDKTAMWPFAKLRLVYSAVIFFYSSHYYRDPVTV